MNDKEPDVARIPGSRCCRCGEFVSDLDAGYNLAANGDMHLAACGHSSTVCGGTWFPCVRTARGLEMIQVCDVCGLVDHHCRSGACPVCNQKIQEAHG